MSRIKLTETAKIIILVIFSGTILYQFLPEDNVKIFHLLRTIFIIALWVALPIIFLTNNKHH